MTILSPKMFRDEVLPRLISKSNNMAAMFTSYNEIIGFNTSDIRSQDQSLHIVVRPGRQMNQLEDIGVGAFVSGDTDIMGAVIDSMEREKVAAQRNLAQSSTESIQVLQQNQNVLVVVYLGLMAFDEALRFTRDVRERLPNAHVAVLTCDCDLEEKEFKLSVESDRGNIDSVMVTRNCGGREDMAQMIKGLERAWTNRDISFAAN